MNTTNLLNRTYFRLGWTRTDGSGNVSVDSTCKFPVETTTSLIDDVLQDFNRRIPKRIIASYSVSPSSSGSSIGSFALPSDLDYILGVYFRFDSTSVTSLVEDEEIVYSNFAFSEDLLERLLNVQDLDEISQYSREQGVDYEILEDHKIQVLGEKYITTILVVYNKVREISEIHDKFISTFSKKLAALAIRSYVAGKERSGGIQRSGGLVEYTGGSGLLELAVSLEDEYEKDMTRFEKLSVVGLRVIA